MSVAKRQVVRCKLHLDAAFLLLVGEGLPNAVACEVCRISKTDLVVLVVGGAEPEANRVNSSRVWTILALDGNLGLLAIDTGLVLRAIDARDVIERVVLRDGGADEATREEVRSADRKAVGACG